MSDIFTGLIGELGTVDEVQRTEDGARLRVRGALARELREGDSVAVNGVCLTAVGLGGGDLFGADVMHETLRRSSLGEIGVCGPPSAEMITTRAESPSESAIRAPSGDHAGEWHANVHWLLASLARSRVSRDGVPPSGVASQMSIEPA